MQRLFLKVFTQGGNVKYRVTAVFKYGQSVEFNLDSCLVKWLWNNFNKKRRASIEYDNCQLFIDMAEVANIKLDKIEEK